MPPLLLNYLEGSNISIGHIGLVADTFDTLGTIAIIDAVLSRHGNTISATSSSSRHGAHIHYKIFLILPIIEK